MLLFTTKTELNAIAVPAISGLQAEGGQRNRASAPAVPGRSPRTSALGKTVF
jgi:hypothetical protein